MTRGNALARAKGGNDVKLHSFTIAFAVLLLSACASTGGRVNADPLEPFNRTMYAIHEPLDENVVKPIAQAYLDYTPRPVRTAVHNFFGNIEDFFSGFNGLLQGKLDKAGHDFGRVMVNSGFGLLGLIDIASDADIPRGGEDFGQTFGHWGVAQGPYLFIPLLGPSSFRDGTGLAIRIAASPILYIPAWEVRTVLEILGPVDLRASLIGTTALVEQAALDRYTFIRRSYLQRRQYEVYDGQPPPEAKDE